MKLSKKIENLRVEAGISQDELADALQVSRQTVYNWESGSTDLKISNIKKLCDYFGVGLDYFSDSDEFKQSVGAETEKPVLSPDEPIPDNSALSEVAAIGQNTRYMFVVQPNEKSKKKTYITLNCIFSFILAFMIILTEITGRITLSNRGDTKVSTSSLSTSHFYLFLVVSILLLIAEIVILVLTLRYFKKEKKKNNYEELKKDF